METTICPECNGKGSWACSACGGRGQISRMTASGELEVTSCLPCYGRGRIVCPSCGGKGNRVVGRADPLAAARSSLQSMVDEYELLRDSGQAEPSDGRAVSRQIVDTFNAAGVPANEELLEKVGLAMVLGPEILIDWLRNNEWID